MDDPMYRDPYQDHHNEICSNVGSVIFPVKILMHIHAKLFSPGYKSKQIDLQTIEMKKNVYLNNRKVS